MAEYPFKAHEQDVVRDLGKIGFRYIHETKKAIRFCDHLNHTIEFNREKGGIALVFGFGDPSTLLGFNVRDRASSNFRDFEIGITSKGNENFQGIQISLRDRKDIAFVVQHMLLTA